MRRPGAIALMMMVTASALAAPGDDERAEPLRAWKGPPVPDAGGEPEDLPPLELQPDGPPPVAARVADLAARGRWVELADVMARVSDGSAPAGLVRERGPGQLLLGGREDVRRRLRELPPPALRAYRALVDDRAALLLREGRRRDGAIGELLERFGATPAGGAGCMALGDRLLERGDLPGALLLWRRALADGGRPAKAVEARLVAGRTLLGVDRPGSLTPAEPEPPREWGVAWGRPAPGGDRDLPRPVAADGVRVYLTDHRGVMAVSRDQGELVWRVALRGEPSQQRMALGRGRLVVARRDRVVGVDCERGVEVWQRSLGVANRPAGPRARNAGDDRVHDVVATCAGFAALVTRDGQRLLVGLAVDGTPLFETRLWPERPQDVSRPRRTKMHLLRPGETNRNGDRVEKEETEPRGEWDPDGRARRVVGDGRLASIADKVVVNLDGVVLCASAAQGGVVWVRERSHGLLVAGSHSILVQVAVGPYAIEAVTAAGHLVRLDPVDGRSLALPRPPEAVPPLGAEEGGQHQPYVLHLSPLVLGWQPHPTAGFFVTAGVPARLVLRLAQGPLGPGAVLGATLALPDPEGVVLVDLVSGHEVLREPLPWVLAPGAVVTSGGLLLTAGRDGVVALRPGDAPTKAPELLDDLPVAAWVELLGHPDWRARLRAQAELEKAQARGLALDPGLLERVAREAPTLDGRDAAKDLLEQGRRRKLFTSLAPGAHAWLMGDLVRGVRLVERLRQLLEMVKHSDQVQDELRLQTLEADDRAVRLALLDILIKADGQVRDRLVATLRDRRQPDALRAGCANAIVTFVDRTGASHELLRDAVAGDEDTAADAFGFISQALVGCNDPEILRSVIPELRREFARPPAPREVPPHVASRALLDALPKLLAP